MPAARRPVKTTRADGEFTLFVNAGTAKQFGINVQPTSLKLADEVIEGDF